MSSAAHRHSQTYSYGDLTVIECEDCGFRHLWPLPSPESLRETYERRFGGDIRPQFREKKREDQEYWDRVFSLRLPILTELLGGVREPRMLDVGCGMGTFASFCRQNGWEVYGIEPSRHFHPDLEACGVTVIPSLVEDIGQDEWSELGQFDVVNMSMFLEHVLDPRAVLTSVLKALRPGGILVLESPNDFNPLQMAAVEAEDLGMWWINALHVNYFDFAGLDLLSREVGCVPEHRFTQFPLEMFLLFGEKYVGDSELGRDVHMRRARFEQALIETGRADLLRDMYDSLASLSVGRQAIIFSRKMEE